MIKIQNLPDLEMIQLPYPDLAEHLRTKILDIFETYHIHTLDQVGYFAVIPPNALDQFPREAVEFVEVLQLEQFTYLHAVYTISDSFSAGYYMKINLSKI